MRKQKIILASNNAGKVKDKFKETFEEGKSKVKKTFAEKKSKDTVKGEDDADTLAKA